MEDDAQILVVKEGRKDTSYLENKDLFLPAYMRFWRRKN